MQPAAGAASLFRLAHGEPASGGAGVRMATRGRGDWNFGSVHEYTAGGLRHVSEVVLCAEEEEDRQEEEEDRQDSCMIDVPVQQNL